MLRHQFRCPKERYINFEYLQINSLKVVIDFINKFPSFKFDLELFVLAMHYQEHLNTSYNLFGKSVAVIASYSPQKEIEAFISSPENQIPAYENLSSFQEITDLPLISKKSLIDRPNYFINRQFNDQILWKKATSGTSGKPVSILYSSEFYLSHLFLTIPKIISTKSNKQWTDNATFFSIHITDTKNSSNWVMPNPVAEFGVLINFVIDQSNSTSFELLAHILSIFMPAVITARPELLDLIITKYGATFAPEKISYKPQFIICSGNMLEEGRKNRIRGFFNCEVINSYLSSEFGLIATEGPVDSLLTITKEVFLQIIDEKGNSCDVNNEGQIVLSSITNKAMPLLRYCSGDYGILESQGESATTAKCQLKLLKGRRVPSFYFKNNVIFSPSCFNNLFDFFPLEEFQVVQSDRDKIEVFVQFDKKMILPKSQIIREMKQHVSKFLPQTIRLEIFEHAFLYESKFQRYQTKFNS